MKQLFIIIAALLAAASLQGQIIPTEQNPRFNSNINPRFNFDINPKYNSRIHPQFNDSLSPRFNTAVNPDFNSGVHPRFNNQINPKYNTAINPKFNFELRPSPVGWSGRFMYDEQANLSGYLTPAGEQVLLLFNASRVWTGFFVKAGANYNLFTTEGEWTGQYLCTNGATGFNLFNKSHDWTGSYVQ